ncbi:MAG: flippase [Candidatus Komeilibacteria bacterium]|nr:flippase [Candidatus Komeilibacteria bacterium]
MALTGRTIAANTLVYSMALTVQKALSFIYFSFLARSLGADQTGKYFFALSLGGIVAGLLDIGLTPVLTREVAKDTTRAGMIASQIVTLKLIILGIVGVAAWIFVPYAFPETLTRHLVILGIVIAAMDSFALTFYAVIRAHQNLLYESASAIGFYIIVIALGGIAIWQRMDLRVIISVLLIAGTANMLFAWLILRKRLQVRLGILWNATLLRSIGRAALPFAVAAVFLKIYAYSDTVMIKFFIHDAAVGWYSIPYKLTFAFQFIPLAFVAALYPAFSYYWKHSKEELSAHFVRSSTYLLLIGLPIAGGIAALAPDLITTIYTDAYAPSIVPLMILICSLPLLFLNFPIGSMLNACDRQTRQMTHLGITTVFNVAMNVVLIPRYGVVGAAVASTVSTVFIFILGVYAIQRVIGISLSAFFAEASKLAASAVLMVAALVMLNRYLPWYMTIVPAGLIYAGGVYALRVVTLRDILSFVTLLKR